MKFHIPNKTVTIPEAYERGRTGRGTLDKKGRVLLNEKTGNTKAAAAQDDTAPDESVKKETGKRRQP